MKKLSVIMPVFNEENNINKVIQNIKRLRLQNIKKEIIIVDDGSWDGTSLILKKYKNDPEIQVHFSRLNFGKGVATRIGLTYATGNIILIQDADLEYNVMDYPKLIKPILENKADVVYGSRFKGEIKGMAIFNYLGNKLLSFLATTLFFRKVTDEATAYKVFKSKVIKDLKLKCKHFEFCPEVTAKVLKNRKVRYAEVPIKYKARKLSEGKKIRLRDGIVAIWTLFKYRIVN
ncbi:glycosyltransferase family 2 protein [Candidatus Margulisiibacteriota bacterium]